MPPSRSTGVLSSTVDGSGETASLTLQMKLHIHIQEVLESLSGHFSDCILGDRGKNCVSKLSKEGGQDSRGAI